MAAAPPAGSSGWLEDVCVGALAGGVNRPTAAVTQAAFAALLLPQLVLLYVALQQGRAVGHVCALLALTLGLLAAVSWCAAGALAAALGLAPRACAALPPLTRNARRLFSQLGLVSAEAQRSELGLDKPVEAPGDADAAAPAAAAAVAPDAKKER